MKKYKWRCNWSNGKGCFDPDYEGCSRKGHPTTSLQNAAKKGMEHSHKHYWGGWGYGPPNWQDHIVSVVEVTKKGEKRIGYCCEILKSKSS
jgi:hypothetical protein